MVLGSNSRRVLNGRKTDRNISRQRQLRRGSRFPVDGKRGIRNELTSIRRYCSLIYLDRAKVKYNQQGFCMVPEKKPPKSENPCYNVVMKCPKCFNPLRRVASTEDSVWFTCPLGHRFHSETGSGISDSEGHRYAVSE